jgi:hypothetical protein
MSPEQVNGQPLDGRSDLGALEAVGAAVQSEAVFGTLPGPGRRQRLSDDDGAAVILTSM